MIRVKDGSTLHYSLLWTPDPEKQRALTTLELIKTIAHCLDNVQDPQVAEKKIHWWHEEIERIQTGNARHPAAVAWQNHHISNGIRSKKQKPFHPIQPACDALSDVLSTHATLRFKPASSDSELNEQISKDFTARLALVSYSLTNDGSQLSSKTQVPAAALGLGKFDRLVCLPSRLHKGDPVFSHETYEKHALSPADLAQHLKALQIENSASQPPNNHSSRMPLEDDRSPIKRFIDTIITDTHNALQTATQNASTRQRYQQNALQPIWITLVLREKQARMWHNKPPNLLKERTILTPIKKYLLAWWHHTS